MNRSTLILIGLLVVLGVIVIFLLPSSQEREVSDKGPEISLSIDSASVTKLEIMRSGKFLTLENVGGKWSITAPGHYQADPSSVTQVLQGLGKFKIGSIISSNPDKQRLFQVDSSGTQITATERSGKSTSIIIGKMGPSFSEVYFRLPGSKDVYLAEGLDTWSVTKELKEWRDKTILSVPSDAVRQISYAAGAKRIEFKKDSTGWKSEQAGVEPATMNGMLTTLSNFRADDFVDTAIKFQNLPVSVNIVGPDNIQLNLYPATPDSSRYYVQSSSSPQIFIVSKYSAQQIMKPIGQHLSETRSAQFASKGVRESRPVPTPVVVKKESKTIAKAPNPVMSRKTPVSNPIATIVPEKKETAPSGKPDLSGAKRFPVKRAQSHTTGGTVKESRDETPLSNIIPEKKTEPVVTEPVVTKPVVTKPVVTKSDSAAASQRQQTSKTPSPAPAKTSTTGADDDGELTVVTVKSGDTMQSIAKKYSVTVEQILKWNLLKSISVKPGQELYVYVKK